MVGTHMRKSNCSVAGTHMFQQVVRLPEQIEFSLSSLFFNIRRTSKFAICGMGTCAIAGEVVSDYMDDKGAHPISVIRGLELPRWVDSDTTVLVISYSGDTPEALHNYRSAVRKGAQVICVTSGGELEELCVKDDNVLMSIPYGFQSRGALGYMIGYIVVALHYCGLIDSYEDFKGALPSVKAYRDELIKDDNNEARRIARFIGNRSPVVYGFFNMRATMLRWKYQFNENSKVLSFCGTFPEFNHNELVGWTSDMLTDRFVPVVLMDDSVSQMLKYMAETPIGMLSDNGTEAYIHHLQGDCLLTNTLRGIILGDLTSLYLAHLKNVDPNVIDASDDTVGMPE